MPAATPCRIVMLVENNTYANDTRVRQEAEALARAGHRVSVICPVPRRTAHSQRIAGVDVLGYPKPRSGNSVLGYVWEYGYSMAATFFLMTWLLMRRGFDVIHAANPPDMLALVAAPFKLLGKQFVFDQHDLAPELYAARFPSEPSRLITRTLLTLERWSYRLANHVIVTNASYRDVALRRGGLSHDDVTIVRNGPDLSVLRNVPLNGASDEPKRMTVLGYVGSIGHHDGVDHFVRALHHLCGDLGRDDFCAVVVGAGDAFDSIVALAEALGLRDKITFTGWKPHAEVARYLSAADICAAPEPANPYNNACTVIKIMEYLALGKPIVAFDLPEHRVSAGDAALYAQPNSELDFARKIASLMDDPEARERMGNLGRQRVRDQLAWQHQVPHLLHVYAKISSR